MRSSPFARAGTPQCRGRQPYHLHRLHPILKTTHHSRPHIDLDIPRRCRLLVYKPYSTLAALIFSVDFWIILSPSKT